MTQAEYIAQVDRQIANIKSGIPLKTAVFATHTRVAKRIFMDGLNSEGKTIGEYNKTHPLYVNPLTGSPKKFPPTGKPYKDKDGNIHAGRSVFKSTGKEHRTGYFDSYKSFREKIGKLNATVNLNLFGILQKDFATGLQQASTDLWYEGVKQEANADKIIGNEAKFGEIFRHTKEEQEFFTKVLNREIMKKQ